MHIDRFPLILTLAILAVAGCQQSDQAQNDAAPTPAAAPAPAETAEIVAIDTTRYILSADLLERMQGADDLYVFDVRSKASFDQSHIRDARHMPYGNTDPEDVAALDGMTLDSPIVTYCGCPHHLAGLSADLLIEWGYRDVRVLYEGFWYWRDHQYPLAGLQDRQTRELSLAGILVEDGQPLAHTDVFIRNTRNGQLEAAVTDASGRFQTGFHVYDYRPDDRFEVRVGSLDARVVRQLTAGPAGTDVVVATGDSAL